VMRTAGQIFQVQPNGQVSNLYNIKLANKTRKDIPVILRLENIRGEVMIIGKSMTVPAESYFQTAFFVKIDRTLLERRKTPLVIGVYEEKKKIQTVETTFLGPGY